MFSIGRIYASRFVHYTILGHNVQLKSLPKR